MSDGITLCCPRCGEYSALHKECDTFNGIDVYTCQKEDCKRRFAIELVIDFLNREQDVPSDEEQIKKEIDKDYAI